MRDPSIHITQSQFRKILKDLGVKRFPTEKLFLQARQIAITARSISVTNRKSYKKAKNITLATTGDANLAADILYAVQIQLKHRGVKKINETDTRRWPLCKQLAEVCNTFCKDFNLSTREGFIQYIKLGFKRMDKNLRNFLPRLISMAQNITDSYQAIQDINHDPSPLETEALHNYYVKVIADRTGIRNSYKENPETYIYFVKVREFCQEQHIEPEDWIDAQFDGLEWCNGLPEPNRLLGDKAMGYYTKFMFKNNKTPNQAEPKVSGSLWDQINNEEDE